MRHSHLPVSEKSRSALSEARKPVARSAEMSTQRFVFLRSPKGQIPIQLAHRRMERRAIIPPVVLEPTSNDGIEHPGQIFDRLVTALWQFPATNLCSNGLLQRAETLHLKIDRNAGGPVILRNILKRSTCPCAIGSS
jgi:hypothetical protein